MIEYDNKSFPDSLSPAFKAFLQTQQLDNRARAMADAMLEVNPNLDLQQAYLSALRSLLEDHHNGEST